MSIYLLVSLPGQLPEGLAAIPLATSVSRWIQGFTLGSHIDEGTTDPLILIVERETVGRFLIRREGTETRVFRVRWDVNKMKCD